MTSLSIRVLQPKKLKENTQYSRQRIGNSSKYWNCSSKKNSKLIAATAPDVIKFVHQGKGLYKAEGLSGKAFKAGKAGKAGEGLYLGKFH